MKKNAVLVKSRTKTEALEIALKVLCGGLHFVVLKVLKFGIKYVGLHF
jgi:hypothetical protein